MSDLSMTFSQSMQHAEFNLSRLAKAFDWPEVGSKLSLTDIRVFFV